MSKAWSDDTTCPDCFGDLERNDEGVLECQSCHQQFFEDDDGSLYTVSYDPYDDYFDD